MEQISDALRETIGKIWDEGIESVLIENPNKQEYNNIPLSWCIHCKSLKIINVDTPLNPNLKCYCGDCYNTEMGYGHITEWKKLKNNLIN